MPLMAADLADKSNRYRARWRRSARSPTRHGDARATLLIGKTALGRGFAVRAFRLSRLSACRSISRSAQRSSRCVVYSIVRQESAFNPRVVSSANALGLMQVTPDAGRYIAKKFNVAFDQHRLLDDPVYNAQIGAAELGDVIEQLCAAPISWPSRPTMPAAPGPGMDRAIRRSARAECRSDRLDRAHPVLGDAQLRAARD